MTDVENVRRVLVVDDDPSFVTFVCAAIEKLDARARVAVTGLDAIRDLGHGAWDGVLLDLRLPDVDGLEVLRVLRERGDPVPVVVVTGAGSVLAAVEAMRLGAVDFLEKPVRLTDLRKAVLALLSVQQPNSPTAQQPNSPTAQQPNSPDRPDRSTAPITVERRIDRLANAMMAVVVSPLDVRSVRAWCALLDTSESNWYALCEVVGVPAKAALDLARLLRAVRCADAGDPWVTFDVADPRTTRGLLSRAGISEGYRPVSLADFLDKQRLCVDRRITDRVSLLLRRCRLL
jgi:CheY-like chemotaxis protein